MLRIFIIAFLWSISPFGEAKVGIPYAIFNGANVYLAFIVCFVANVLVFPIMMFFLDTINGYLIKWRPYKKSAIYVAQKAKFGAKKGVQKYGFWGLMLFVMVPLPGTGVYAGTIAAYIFGFDRKQAFFANTIGIFFSSVIVWAISILTSKGIAIF